MSAADMRREQKKLDVIEDRLEKEVGGSGEEGGSIAMGKKKPKKDFTKAAKAVAGAGAGVKKGVRGKSENDRCAAAPGDGKQAETEAEDDGDAEEIQLNGFNFSTHLTASPPPPSNLTDTSKSSPAISAEQRADQRARLAARIEALRAKRRADSPDGAPARNRHELMAARRREEAVQRKERKKEIRLHQRAAAEQTKDVAQSPKKNLTPKKDDKYSQSQPSKGENPPKDKHIGNINPPPDHRRGGKGGKGRVSKKANSKKSRPGFEGSLKSSKGTR